MSDNIISLQAQSEFKERFLDLIDNMENLILKLQRSDEYKESVKSLFRMFHSLKALSGYSGLKSANKIFKNVEDVLGLLIYKKPPLKQQVIDWLFVIYDHLYGWYKLYERQECEYPDYEIDSYTLNMIKVSVLSRESPCEIMRGLSFLVIEPKDEFVQGFKDVLAGKIKRFITAKSTKEAAKIVEKESVDVIIMDLVEQDEMAWFAKKVHELVPEMPIAIMYKRKNQQMISGARIAGVEEFMIAPLDFEECESVALNIARHYYDKKALIISGGEVAESIEKLSPLPSTIKEVQIMARDESIGVGDMVDVISKDPILTAKILKITNSSYYGFNREINCIQHAATMLGKSTLAAIAFQSYSDALIKGDLAPYEMTKEQFYEVSRKRLKLMKGWYSKVSFSRLPVLATTALIGNLGQFFISNKIESLGLENEFKLLLSNTNYIVAESELLHTTTENVTADTLLYWGLDHLISDAIRYSFEIDAASNEIKPFAIANYVVYSTIPVTGEEIDKEKIEEMADFLDELNLNKEHYLRAVEKL